MDKEIVVYLNNGILYSNDNELFINIWNNMDNVIMLIDRNL